MKLLSVAVPCYNSQAYMRNCVDSLLEGGDLVEILIVDDGSKDDTGKIADEYAAKYPNIVKAIHQENGGHGEAVNTGIRNATGLYFKVVDSDDWVNAEAYHAILDKLQEITGGPQVLDMMISNFVYEKQGAKRKKVMKYTKYMPEGRIFTWKEMGKMPHLDLEGIFTHMATADMADKTAAEEQVRVFCAFLLLNAFFIKNSFMV